MDLVVVFFVICAIAWLGKGLGVWQLPRRRYPGLCPAG
jgi:hypothetical protein